MADNPSIESLRDICMVNLCSEDEAAMNAALTELESLRAENESLKAELKNADEVELAHVADVNRMIAQRNEARDERDAERARADALAASLGRVWALATHDSECDSRVGGKCNCPYYSTPAADLEAHDAKVREPLEKRMAELEDVLRDIEAYDDKPQVWRSKLGGVLAGAFVSAAHTGKADCSCNECLWVHEETAAHDARVRREALEEAWERMGHAPDPHDPGFFVCNHITVDRWYALRAAILGPDPQPSTASTAPREEETK